VSPSYRLRATSHWTRLTRTSAADLRRLQDRALAQFVREELYPFSAHYRRVFDAAGVSPRDVRGRDDLRRLPFTTKEDLLTAQTDPEHRLDFVLRPSPASIKAHWPFLRKLALVLGGRGAREALRRSYTPNFLTFTTGRSSEPVAFTYTPYDIDVLGEAGGRLLEVLGVSDPMWRVLNMFPFAPHLAFWQVTLAGFSTGQMVVPTGGGKVLGTAGNLRSIDRLKPNVLVATPGYLYHVLREGAEKGVDYSPVKLLILGAEKVPPGLKVKMAEVLEAGGARDVKIVGTYGFTEARMAFGECPTAYDVSSGYHLYADLGLVEIVDPESGEPVADGEPGEVVYTGLAGHGTVVCRYRTGDMAVEGLTWEPCPHCGRTGPRLGSELRRVSQRHALNLTKVKGTLVDLSHIGTIVSSQPGVEEWQVVLRKKDDDPLGLDELVLRLAAADGVDREKLRRTLDSEIQTATEVGINEIEFMPREELLEALGMETEMKEKRFLDLRPK
jgi:phenylacetate-coenzyme A ligase PaaK-like adenylate-forming protein